MVQRDSQHTSWNFQRIDFMIHENSEIDFMIHENWETLVVSIDKAHDYTHAHVIGWMRGSIQAIEVHAAWSCKAQRCLESRGLMHAWSIRWIGIYGLIKKQFALGMIKAGRYHGTFDDHIAQASQPSRLWHSKNCRRQSFILPMASACNRQRAHLKP